MSAMQIIFFVLIVIICQQIESVSSHFYNKEEAFRRRLKNNKHRYRRIEQKHHWKNHRNFDPNFETTSEKYKGTVGNDRDEYGCVTSGGYIWCEPTSKCYREWEEECTTLESSDSTDSTDMNENNSGCDDFMRNGEVYALLEADAAVLLRGMNLMSSDDEDKQREGITLYEQQLYPFILDSFTWVNIDGGTVVSNKQELKDNAVMLAEALPNSNGIESNCYFECFKTNDLVMIMHFNAVERWDDAKSDVSRKEGGSPDIIERWWNCAMYFEYDYEKQQFMISAFEYDDPLTDEE